MGVKNPQQVHSRCAYHCGRDALRSAIEDAATEEQRMQRFAELAAAAGVEVMRVDGQSSSAAGGKGANWSTAALQRTVEQ